ncbi:hypothetical protein [Nocardioides ferulae]|uniref:hypothetical protein n=1 Tax=Nocardioides ferulae TaxID=2340821 RepID=UPI000EB10AC0|nr:hypothetical protein [Nocardioides ferulae]
MSEPGEPVAAESRDAADWQRRRRLAEVFGDALPDTTRDERDDSGRPDARQGSENEAWLRAQVPPHHGG